MTIRWSPAFKCWITKWFYPLRSWVGYYPINMYNNLYKSTNTHTQKTMLEMSTINPLANIWDIWQQHHFTSYQSTASFTKNICLKKTRFLPFKNDTVPPSCPACETNSGASAYVSCDKMAASNRLALHRCCTWQRVSMAPNAAHWQAGNQLHPYLARGSLCLEVALALQQTWLKLQTYIKQSKGWETSIHHCGGQRHRTVPLLSHTICDQVGQCLLHWAPPPPR